MSCVSIPTATTTAGRPRTLSDRRFATLLAREDAAEERGDLSPHDRLTCRVHRRWAHQCISSPIHVIPVTGHRWCRHCEIAESVAVDEVSGTVVMSCPSCGQSPTTLASWQIVRTCRASLAKCHPDRGQARTTELPGGRDQFPAQVPPTGFLSGRAS